MATKNKRATINVTKQFKDELDKMKHGTESYETVLKREIGCYETNLENIKEPIAFRLEGEYADMEDYALNVYWTELYKSKVGDSWELPDNENCIKRETASVCYKDENLVFVKIKTYENGEVFSKGRIFNFFSEY
ncbi:hypothetical protein [uncultured Methanobrevibacter sp.]|uniref:hypothetical protein n=1 Tax=uncultured Methanobrevibacter sp. TaxID=253161 RepID=UPI002626AA49